LLQTPSETNCLPEKNQLDNKAKYRFQDKRAPTAHQYFCGCIVWHCGSKNKKVNGFFAHDWMYDFFWKSKSFLFTPI
jgi:hypothetical protein